MESNPTNETNDGEIFESKSKIRFLDRSRNQIGVEPVPIVSEETV